MKISQILILIAYVFQHHITSVVSCTNCTEFSRSLSSQKNVLSRKKRFLIFPKGANVLNTAYLVKQLMGNIPTGFNMLTELDIFWPLPFEPRIFTTARDLFLGKYKKPKPPPPVWLQQPKQPSYSTYPPKLNIEDKHPQWIQGLEFDSPPPSAYVPHSHHGHDDHSSEESWEHDHPGEIFVPPSGWTDDVLKNLADGIEQNQTRRRLGGGGGGGSWKKDNNYYYPTGRSLHDTSTPNVEAHYFAHKDRKEIYDIIHAAFMKGGMDSTACLQRTICEVKHFLLPKGKSLLHDVFRVFFTYPLAYHIDDKWAVAARAESEDDCHEVFGTDCPFSVLDFFLHSDEVF